METRKSVVYTGAMLSLPMSGNLFENCLDGLENYYRAISCVHIDCADDNYFLSVHQIRFPNHSLQDTWSLEKT